MPTTTFLWCKATYHLDCLFIIFNILKSKANLNRILANCSPKFISTAIKLLNNLTDFTRPWWTQQQLLMIFTKTRKQIYLRLNTIVRLNHRSIAIIILIPPFFIALLIKISNININLINVKTLNNVPHVIKVHFTIQNTSIISRQSIRNTNWTSTSLTLSPKNKTQ